jgi:hypothetical protein
MTQTLHTSLTMAQNEDQRLAILNSAMIQLMEALENKDLASDARQRFEKELLRLIDRRIEIEEKANRTLG